MKKLTKYLTEPFLTEDIKVPVEIGDTVLMGRFKNKRVSIGTRKVIYSSMVGLH